VQTGCVNVGDDLYRCSDPLRYLPLVEATERALDRLECDYDVFREEGRELDPALTPQAREDTRVVRLTPGNLGAPVTVALQKDAFAGVVLRLGKSFAFLLPVCGCDYCARPEDGERVEDVIDDLEQMLAAVSEGRFSEQLIQGAYVCTLRGEGRSWGPGLGDQAFPPAPNIAMPPSGRWERWRLRADS
jgi:Family of unknown function (DUF6226)